MSTPLDRRAMAGFTLVELLLVTLLGAVVLGAIYQTLMVQERGYRQQHAVISTQNTTRTALGLLESELREISAVDGDLVVAEPDSIGFRASRKVGMICQVDATWIGIWQLGEAFIGSDSVLVFVDNDPALASDDQWRVQSLASTASTACPTPWNSYPERRLNVTGGGNLAGIQPGSPIRSFVRLTYGLFEIDGQWVLGRREPDGSLVPLVGPLASRADGGLVFRYLDASGAVTTNPADVSRIELHIRGRAVGGSYGSREFADSLTTQLFLRNN